MTDEVSRDLEDWPAPPEIDPLRPMGSWENTRVYAETRFLADVLHGDIELYLGPSKKLQSTWDRAVQLQRKLEWERKSRRHEHFTGGAAAPREDQAGKC